jgi:hypothetical protein
MSRRHRAGVARCMVIRRALMGKGSARIHLPLAVQQAGEDGLALVVVQEAR